MRHLQNATLALALLLSVHATSAQTPAKNAAPVPEHQGLQATSDCSHCHGNKTGGKSVHTAMELGCARCHSVATDGRTTNVRLIMPKVQLCLACHLRSSDEILHAPYVKGRCTSCHDPHSSDYPVHLRGESNALCLECHPSQGAQANAATSTPDQPQAANDPPGPLSFEAAVQTIHGSAESFVTMLSALQDGNKPVLCLTCHEPHSSHQSKLLRSSIGPGL